MKIYRQLTALAAVLHEHSADSAILIPETAAAALRPQTVGDFATLFAPTIRFIVQPADAPLRLGYRQWLTVGALQRIRQDLPAALSQADWLNILATHLIALPAEPISNADIPPLAWAELADDEARIQWWMQCVHAYLNGGEFTPASRAALDDCEQRIGCPLPRCCAPTTNTSAWNTSPKSSTRPSASSHCLTLFPGWKTSLKT